MSTLPPVAPGPPAPLAPEFALSRAFEQAVTVGFLRIDRDATLAQFSRAFLALLRISQGELHRGCAWLEFAPLMIRHARHPAEALDELNRLLSDSSLSARTSYELVDGHAISVEICPPLPDGSRAFFLSRQSLAHPMTPAADESERAFRQAFMACPIQLSLTTLPDGRIFATNEEHCRLSGFTQEELVGRTALECNLLADPADHHRVAEGLYRDGAIRDREFRFRRKDGTSFPGLMSCSIVSLEGRAMVLTSCRDLSALREAEDRLRAEHAWLEVTLASVGDAIVNVDAEHRVVLLNLQAEQLLGYASAEAHGRHVDELVPVRKGERISDTISRSSRQGKPVGRLRDLDASRTVLSRAGNPYSVTVRVGPLQGGTSAGSVVVLHELTEDLELERMKGDFVAAVSHELRTPLTTIKGSIDTLLRTPDMPPEVRTDFLEMAQRQAGRLERLVREILLLSRIERSNGLSAPEPVDLVRTARAALEEVHADLSAKHLRLSLDVANGEPLVVLGRPDQLLSLVVNLLSNAVKFTPAGGHVRVDLRRESPMIVIEISDTGIGIPEAELPLIFEQFYRSSKLGKEFPGTGLGLAIVKSVVALHSGTVSVRSTEGQGSTFTVRLPSEPPRA